MPAEPAPDLTAAAEAEWLEAWKAGPGGSRSHLIEVGSTAPDLTMPDEMGRPIELSALWSDGMALMMFWRHFGCSCGIDRAARLADEYADYAAAGLNPVIIGQGEPARAAAYKERYEIHCPILCDPDFEAYRAYGLGDFGVEQVLYDAAESYWSHSEEIGIDFQAARRSIGRPLVDSPWMSAGEFVIDDGTVLVSYVYQYCEDFPDPRMFTTAARLQL